MLYRERVQLYCDKLGISNPINEEDLAVSALSFEVNGEWKRIEGTDMNRAGRLFFQLIFGGINYNPNEPETETAAHIIAAAEEYFAENWLDAREKGRAMLIALMDCTHFRVHWKEEFKRAPKPTWYKTFL